MRHSYDLMDPVKFSRLLKDGKPLCYTGDEVGFIAYCVARAFGGRVNRHLIPTSRQQFQAGLPGLYRKALEAVDRTEDI